MGRALVITADDLGVDPAGNATIIALLREGRISATTLIPVAPAAKDAARRLTAAGLPQARLHFTLTSDRGLAPWRPMARDVPSLVDAGGHLPRAAAVAEHRATRADVRRELDAQLDWMRTAGLRPAALDSHGGTLYGLRGRSLVDVALEFCAEHRLALRLPRHLGSLWHLAARGLGAAHRRAVPWADAHAVALPQALVSSWLPGGLVLSYSQLRAEVLGQLRRLPPGTSELFVHPAPSAAAGPRSRREARKRLWELRLLRDPALWRTLREERIAVVPAW